MAFDGELARDSESAGCEDSGSTPIFHPEVSNLFPIAIVANAVFAGGAALYTPVAVIAAICRPPSSDIIEVLPD
jgi:hypothetical protein